MMGARIAALRRGAGMSQSDLAAKMGISSSAVGMYEQGRREPSLDVLIRLSQMFHVTLDYLVLGVTRTRDDSQALELTVSNRVTVVDQQLSQRRDRPFSRQELTVLFAAMMMEP